MSEKYNLFFVPRIGIRKNANSLRSKICKEVHSTQALQYPLHMSLISGGFNVKNQAQFEQEVMELCKKVKPIKLQVKRYIDVLPERFWTGISITRTNDLTKIQKEFQLIRNKFANQIKNHPFYPPHITLAFPAKVEKVKIIKCPFNDLVLDRITIVKKDKQSNKYKIFKHIKLG